jgi:uncharacterized membrane protein YccC
MKANKYFNFYTCLLIALGLLAIVTAALTSDIAVLCWAFTATVWFALFRFSEVSWDETLDTIGRFHKEQLDVLRKELEDTQQLNKKYRDLYSAKLDENIQLAQDNRDLAAKNLELAKQNLELHEQLTDKKETSPHGNMKVKKRRKTVPEASVQIQDKTE